MHINIFAVLVAALVPTVIGMIWYNPKVLGTAWMAASGMTEEKAKQANMAVVFSVSLLLSFFMAFGMQFMVIHQFHVTSMFYKQPIDDPNSEMGALYAKVMELLGTGYRTFKHGALHGFIGSIMIVLPVIGTGSLFEGKGAKYIFINWGYWAITMMIMGGILSAWM
jgi:hypothetical protein